MTKNQPLEDVVLTQLYKHISNVDQSLKSFAEGDEEWGREIVRVRSNTRIDEQHKVRVHFAHFVGYGYDFTQNDEGTSSKETYELAVGNTRKFGGGPNMESLFADGIIDNRFGWYITKLPS